MLRSSMHPCPGTWVAIGRAAVTYARVAHAFSTGIKCCHCGFGAIITLRLIVFICIVRRPLLGTYRFAEFPIHLCQR